MSVNYLLISDLQLNFEHKDALKFCIAIKKHYKINDENCYNLGDELDQVCFSSFDSDPDGIYTPKTEMDVAREKLKYWYSAFPKMKLCISNHGIRYQKKAFRAGIPSEMLRKYEEIINAPDGWIWKKQWLINDKHPFMTEHGDAWGGQLPHKQAAIHNGISTAMGHHHSIAGVEYIRTHNKKIWGACGGSLIDFEAYAFNYGRDAKLKPAIGTLVVLNSGRQVEWIPLE